MTSQHRGCHWHEQHKRWRVVFKVNGKQEQFGHFKTLEEAQKRSDEVWPTLPIAQRSVKTCSECGITGRTGKEFHWNKPVCKKCGRKQRQEVRQALENRQCKVCGKSLKTRDKRQTVCSAECGHKGRKRATKTIPCVICGKTLERYETTKTAACSKQCQRIWAAKQCNIKKQQRRDPGVEHRQLEKVKQRWYRNRSRERRNANQWFRLCVRESGKPALSQQPEWERRCANAVVCLSMRCMPISKTSREDVCNNWQSLINTQVTRLKAKTKQSSWGPWERKVLNAISSLAKRRRRGTREQ